MNHQRPESEQLDIYRTILSALDEGIVFLNPGVQIFECNPRAEQILGLTADEIAGRTSMDPRWRAIHEDGSPFPGTEHPSSITLSTGEPCRNVIMGVHKPTGELTWISINSQGVFRPGQTLPYAAVVSFTDITSRLNAEKAQRAAEQRLAEAQRLESVGRLAGGIAHELNNQLTVVNGYADIIARGLATGQQRLQTAAESVARAGAEAAQIARKLMVFGREALPDAVPVDLNRLVSESYEIFRPLIGGRIVPSLDLDASIPHVAADPGELRQLLLNLVLNARDAMPEGGRLTIETRASRDSVSLIVRDTGIGMTPEVRARIFEPFFTTKPEGAGNGLGLAVVYRVVTQRGGRISVESAPNQGASFRIELPEAAIPLQPARSGGTASMTVYGEGRVVLVLDDRPDIVALVSAVLSRNRYRVLQADTVDVALQTAERFDGPIDILLTDVIMPGLDGTEVSRRLTLQRPGLKSLFMTAYSDDMLVKLGVETGPVDVMRKPFQPQELLERVARALSCATPPVAA